nr:hypothetical protein [uncultured Rhodopila sp.]
MPDPTLVAAGKAFFSEHASIAARLKIVLLEDERPKGLDLEAAAKLHAAVDMIHACIITDAGAGNQRRTAQAAGQSGE